MDTFKEHVQGHAHGTIIYFENIKEGIRNSLNFLEKILALYFRFSLYDPDFKIHLNGKVVDQTASESFAERDAVFVDNQRVQRPIRDRAEGEFHRARQRNKELQTGSENRGVRCVSREAPRFEHSHDG